MGEREDALRKRLSKYSKQTLVDVLAMDGLFLGPIPWGYLDALERLHASERLLARIRKLEDEMDACLKRTSARSTRRYLGLSDEWRRLMRQYRTRFIEPVEEA